MITGDDRKKGESFKNFLVLIGKMKKRKFEYIIKVNGKEVWRGPNPKKKFEEVRKKNPSKEVGIGIEPGEEILIA
jgi:hypothetical protein